MVRQQRRCSGPSWDAYGHATVDPTFRSVQEIALNEKAIASAESAIRACEEELLRLKQIKPLDSGMLSSGATSRRINFLLRKLEEAEVKLETLETKNTGLKKGLKQPWTDPNGNLDSHEQLNEGTYMYPKVLHIWFVANDQYHDITSHFQTFCTF